MITTANLDHAIRLLKQEIAVTKNLELIKDLRYAIHFAMRASTKKAQNIKKAERDQRKEKKAQEAALKEALLKIEKQRAKTKLK